MKFRNASRQVITGPELKKEYDASHAIGNVRAGKEHLFFRSGLSVYALKYTELERCYRRVMRVPMKMCCGAGQLDVEYLVAEDASGDLAQIQLPGRKAAVMLMEELRAAAPQLQLTKPDRKKDADSGRGVDPAGMTGREETE